MKVTSLSVLGLIAVYASVVTGELLVSGGLARRLLGGMGLTITAVRLVVHTLVTLPVASVVGHGLARYAPVAGRKAVTVVALLWSIFIVVLQLVVYEPRVAGASVLKVLFVVGPLFMGRSMAQRRLARLTQRIVGLPGDRIQMLGGGVSKDGQEQQK